MWITRTIFCGREKNKTTEESESTTKEYAEKMYDRQINRWLEIIVGNYFIGVVREKLNFSGSPGNNDIKLQLIESILLLSKSEDDVSKMSFSIEMFEKE